MAGSRMSKWWPIGVFIAALIFIVIGAALIGVYEGSCISDSFNYNYYDDNYLDYDNYYIVCDPIGEFYGGIACIVIGALLKIAGWILVLIWCIKRRHARRSYAAPMAQPAHTPQPQPSFVAPQPTYPPQHPPQPSPYASGMPPGAAASYYNDMPREAPSTTSSPPPKEPIPTTTRTCGQCGAAVTSPFCPQCGYQN